MLSMLQISTVWYLPAYCILLIRHAQGYCLHEFLYIFRYFLNKILCGLLTGVPNELNFDFEYFHLSNTWFYNENYCLLRFCHPNQRKSFGISPSGILSNRNNAKSKRIKQLTFAAKDDKHDHTKHARLWFVRYIKENTSQFSINKFLANFPRQFRRIICIFAKHSFRFKKQGSCRQCAICSKTHTHTQPNQTQFQFTIHIVFVNDIKELSGNMNAGLVVH